MTIQWYPGHMHKAGKEIKTALAHVDVAIEILDARLPFSSENPFLAKLRDDKPCIKVLNKCDLADPDATRNWQDYLEQKKNVKTLALSKNDGDKIRQIPGLCRKLAQSGKSEGKLIHALIMGIPNVGKSTLINILASRKVAKTGDEPAVTRQQQRIDIGNDVILLDTPGMLWPNLENKASAYRLAATAAIKDTAISHDDVACFLLEFLAQHNPELLISRYHLENIPVTALALLELIGRKRGCLRAGGAIELDKAAKIVLSEFRSGTLGNITLETPLMMEQELAGLEVIRQERAAKKLARKNRQAKPM